MKENVIITASDSKFSDFVADNWLPSLIDNVDMTNTDIVVLDYGFNKDQCDKVHQSGAKIIKCKRDGVIGAVRFRDMSNLLKRSEYKQVMSCDGGDIIFQSDINSIFYIDKAKLKAVCEQYALNFNIIVSLQGSIDPDLMSDIKEYLPSKKLINIGVIVGPRKKFIEMCDFCYKNIIKKNKIGPDQVLINYFMYKYGFCELDQGYNFIFHTTNVPFKIINGKFFYRDNKLIPIVHNAGRFSFIRPIENFGYGIGHNKLKMLRYYMVKLINNVLHKIFGVDC